MEIQHNKRFILVKALECLIEEKQFEIEQIKKRTEDDYEIRKRTKEALGGVFSLEKVIQKDVERVKREIEKIEDIKRDIDNTKNRLLLVPNYIQLHLTGK
ncbi:hypothetical protein [Bacillus cereus]|uniref:hypothetical protein n=1 Tax=Bacillus cereus TaxID=1396 RepID=UPI000BF59EB1|nr:hypothetical protein [Bacillus cereus]PEY77798.1 hypothetical protein CN344_16185 [Bacillus cereus]PGL14360.1 hypothetical protein CN912_06095 [Bacillus cereus]PGP76649.1 hypothetical protein CN999_26370 [Bacillus cereus]